MGEKKIDQKKLSEKMNIYVSGQHTNFIAAKLFIQFLITVIFPNVEQSTYPPAFKLSDRHMRINVFPGQ